MVCAVNNWKEDSWLKSSGKSDLSKLLGVKVLAARAHSHVRNKMFSTKMPKERVRRLTVMMTENSETKLSDDWGRTNYKMAEPWKGVTIFYVAPKNFGGKQSCFLDTPEGLVPVWMTDDEMEDAEHIYASCKGIYVNFR